MTAAPDAGETASAALVSGALAPVPRHLQSVPPAVPMPRTPPMPRHLRSVSASGVHHHEWIVREALNTETGVSTSWFECQGCGQSYN